MLLGQATTFSLGANVVFCVHIVKWRLLWPLIVASFQTLQRFSHLDQSLYERFVRLGTPCIVLDMQGRARPSLGALYSWKYPRLGNLPLVETAPLFAAPNPGLAYEYQFIDVGDYQGRGESSPLPHFYQNLGEAEYVVAAYIHMRLMGYPKERIAILTSYNGQLALLQDVLQQKCAWNPAIGMPRAVATVDKFQGLQSDCRPHPPPSGLLLHRHRFPLLSNAR